MEKHRLYRSRQSVFAAVVGVACLWQIPGALPVLASELVSAPFHIARSQREDARQNLLAPQPRSKKLFADPPDHEGVRAGVDSGRYVPLSSVLATIRQRYPGKQLDTRTHKGRGPGQIIYEIRWLTPDGRRLDITADAHTGHLLNVKGQ